MTSRSMKVVTVGPSGAARVYKSTRAASRSLSGTGSDGKRSTISRRVHGGGGYLGRVWVQGLPDSN